MRNGGNKKKNHYQQTILQYFFLVTHLSPLLNNLILGKIVHPEQVTNVSQITGQNK